MHKHKMIFAAAVALLALAAPGLPALADDYPSRPITMIVPYPPGGPSDVVARIMSEA